jgi:cell division protein FtsL
MSEIESHLPAIMSILVTVIGVIVWLVRLEGKILNSEKRIAHMETEIEAMNSGLVKELGEVRQALARIEGYLKAKSESFND